MRNLDLRRGLAVAAITLIAASLAACGKSASDSSSGSGAESAAATTGAALTTPAAASKAGDLVWGTYRETNSLDPIYAFDYPENTAITMLCESLLHQSADGSITTDGLAASVDTTDPLKMVITLRDGVTFWDGAPVTADDVVYSLGRAQDAKLGGFYSNAFARVKSIDATSANTVTITLKQADQWLYGELSSMPGVIYEKAFAEKAGADFGTVKGGTMCTGAYKLDTWKTGEGVKAVPNATYWDTAHAAQAASITLKGIPDEAAATSAFLTGELSGSYQLNISTLAKLQAATDKVTVTQGPSYAIDAFIISSFKGTLGDARVRQALSLAMDRDGIISTLYKGAGNPARTLPNPGTWGYAPEVFQAGWDALPAPTRDLEKAKQLVKDAGAEGKTVNIGMSNEIASLSTSGKALQAAAQSIGLKANLVSVSAANYINFFIDAKARESVDGFFTINYPDYADPAALLATLALPGGSQNYSGYENPEVTKQLEAARSEADPTKRAEDVVAAQKLVTEDVPWIPVVAPNTILIVNSKLTGVPTSFQYMFAPWANGLGTK
ncbi:MAG: ABC transporter substrate-binding protein [Gaiellales bacterium]